MTDVAKFRPERRGRRLRRTEPIRRMFSETRLHPDMFVAPVFAVEGNGRSEEVDGMPGVSRYSVDRLPSYFERLVGAGVRSVLLFGVPGSKDERGTGAYAPDGIVPRAISSIRRSFPELVVMADVCLCEYTSHGHCGVLSGEQVDNDETLPLLSRAAVEYARAGADVVAPSAMMDGQVHAIRRALDEAGLDDTVVMGYSAKHASAFYGPFRNAAGSAPSFGDRRGYQMQPGNRREALREVEEDVKEGADIVMVKPALAYLDVISEARRRFGVPLAAYNVSGEYSMLKAAALNGWLDEKSAALEVLTAIRRAGADLIITYFAEQAAGWVKEGR
ncbi:MAG: porphobilinogen synthase [Nitrososphaerota archaeon]|jgi:porphobilinogen synthase|nr:porphobilinogen synthase [Nitrososphaerota archaeon]MDG6916421.1 porphobilinogen synthase [Nitrososphaerota archaeon]MDG6918864.1 porphobilinogen synthase [Nitrososphaerota archaeon]MDG6946520.1 porphobilinogen synthase [Nitrososphaerota archaeon]